MHLALDIYVKLQGFRWKYAFHLGCSCLKHSICAHIAQLMSWKAFLKIVFGLTTRISCQKLLTSSHLWQENQVLSSFSVHFNFLPACRFSDWLGLHLPILATALPLQLGIRWCIILSWTRRIPSWGVGERGEGGEQGSRWSGKKKGSWNELAEEELRTWCFCYKWLKVSNFRQKNLAVKPGLIFTAFPNVSWAIGEQITLFEDKGKGAFH